MTVNFSGDDTKLRTAVYPSNKARTAAKLGENAFRTIPDISFFNAKKHALTNFLDLKKLLLAIVLVDSFISNLAGASFQTPFQPLFHLASTSFQLPFEPPFPPPFSVISTSASTSISTVRLNVASISVSTSFQPPFQPLSQPAFQPRFDVVSTSVWTWT